MSKKEDFHDRLNRFISYLGLKPTSFEAQMGFSNGSIGKALAEKRALGSDRLEIIFYKYPELNADWLMTGKGSMIKIYSQNGEDSKDLKNHFMPAVVTVNQSGKDNMILVPLKAQAGYVRGLTDQEYFGKLPAFSLPRYTNGVFRAFEVEGYSMLTEQGIGLHPTDYVLGKYVEKLEDIKDNKVYIIVNNAPVLDNILIKRCFNTIKAYHWLLCKSDNKSGEYPDIHLDPKNIKEIWEWKGLISAYYPNVTDIYDELNSIKIELSYLRQQIVKPKSEIQ